MKPGPAKTGFRDRSLVRINGFGDSQPRPEASSNKHIKNDNHLSLSGGDKPLGWAEGAGGLVVCSGGSAPLNTGSGGRYAAIPNTNQVIESWGFSGSQDLRISGSQGLRDSGTQDLRISGTQDLRISGSQGLRDSGSRNVRWLGLAEREGFEPSVPRKRYAGLASRCNRPLCHLSALDQLIMTTSPPVKPLHMGAAKSQEYHSGILLMKIRSLKISHSEDFTGCRRQLS